MKVKTYLEVELIKKMYSKEVAKKTKELKQIMKFIEERRDLTAEEKKKMKKSINIIYNRVYSNTKSTAIANEIITAIAFKMKILKNKNYKNSIDKKIQKFFDF